MHFDMQLDVNEINGLASFEGEAIYDSEWSNPSDCDGTTFDFIESKIASGARYMATTFDYDHEFTNVYRKPRLLKAESAAMLKLLPSSKPLLVFLFSIQKFSEWLRMARTCQSSQWVKIDVSLSSQGFPGQGRPKNAWKTCSFDEFLNGSPFQFDKIDGQVTHV